MCRFVSEVLGSMWAAALVLVLLGATPGRASTVLDFDLSSSRVQVGSVLTVSPGVNGTASGTARVQLDGVDELGRPTGPTAQASIMGLSLDFAVDQMPIPNTDVRLVGSIGIRQTGVATGAFDCMTLTLAPNAFSSQLAVNVSCVGTACAVFSALRMVMLPIVLSPTVANANPLAVSIFGFDGPIKQLQATIQSQSNGVVTLLAIRGRSVPEPQELGLLMLGVLAVCGAGAARRRRSA